MASAIITFLIAYMVSAHGCGGVDSAYVHVQCNSDHQCPDGFFCYEESQYCTRCLECSSYKRKSSWRACPKTPSDCGACISGHEEEIMHEGRTRDMCIASQLNALSHTTVREPFYERYIWAAAVTTLVLPILYYAFCRKSWRRDRGSIHHGLPGEEPPPYRSIELTTLTSNNSEERLSVEDHVLEVGQQKDSLVQAVPFRQPDYVETEFLAFDNNVESNSEDAESSPEDRVVSNVDLHEENTMPSDWTPAEGVSNEDNQLMTFELPEAEVSESEDTCEPASKRHRPSNDHEDQEPTNTQLNINLIINNNVTIHKPS